MFMWSRSEVVSIRWPFQYNPPAVGNAFQTLAGYGRQIRAFAGCDSAAFDWAVSRRNPVQLGQGERQLMAAKK